MINVKNLTKSYAEVQAVRGIDFSINKGEVVGILGPNGAGKSSTIRILCGFLSATSGEVVIGGNRFVPGREMVEVKEMIGYLPESAPLYSDMIVYDFLKFVYDVRGKDPVEAEKSVLNVLMRCGLLEMKHKNIGELSKGYRQRVGLAHALIGDPEILVLDEPTSGLDPNQIVEIRTLIREISQKKTIILCSHILSEIEATCDRVIIIKDGLIVADDSIENLKRLSTQGAALELLFADGSPEQVENALKQLAGVNSIELIAAQKGTSGSFAFVVRYEKGNTQADMQRRVFDLVKNHDWQLASLQQRVETLENVFRDLTSKKASVPHSKVDVEGQNASGDRPLKEGEMAPSTKILETLEKTADDRTENKNGDGRK